MTFKYQAEGSHLSDRELLFFNLCLNNCISEVKKFIKEGINVNIRDSLEWTPLMSSACHRYFKIVKYILDKNLMKTNG